METDKQDIIETITGLTQLFFQLAISQIGIQIMAESLKDLFTKRDEILDMLEKKIKIERRKNGNRNKSKEKNRNFRRRF